MNSDVVATDLGSLPGGGFERRRQSFIQAELLDSNAVPSYLDLSFGDKLAFQVDGVISAESERLIAFTELGFRAAAPGIQTPPGSEEYDCPLDGASKDAETLYGRIASFVPPVLEGRENMQALSHRFNVPICDRSTV